MFKYCFNAHSSDAVSETQISPSIISPPLPVYESLFSMVNLTCVADGYPDPAIQWWFNGDRLDGDVSEILVIPELMVEQRGRYSCTASGASITVNSEPVVVNIQGKLLTAWAISPSNIFSDAFTFHCQVLPSTRLILLVQMLT